MRRVWRAIVAGSLVAVAIGVRLKGPIGLGKICPGLSCWKCRRKNALQRHDVQRVVKRQRDAGVVRRLIPVTWQAALRWVRRPPVVRIGVMVVTIIAGTVIAGTVIAAGIIAARISAIVMATGFLQATVSQRSVETVEMV